MTSPLLQKRQSTFWRLVFGIYLLLYPLPWLHNGTTPLAVIAWLCGSILLLTLPFLSGRLALPLWGRALAGGAIGLALLAFNGYWGIYFIFVSATCGAMESRVQSTGLFVFLLAVYGIVSVLAGQTSDIPVTVIVAIGTFVAGRLQMGLYRQNIRLAEAQEQIRHLTVAAERERIARDLHDTLGQTLTLIALRSDLALRRIGASPSVIQDDLVMISHAARTALSETRQTVSSMRIATLSQELAQACAALENSGIRYRVVGTATAMPAQHEGVLAMILREGVTNVIRHANAACCTVMFASGSDKRAILEIRDDGQTAFQQGLSFREGNGITGMRARLAELGGTLIMTCSAQGTTLRITLGDTP